MSRSIRGILALFSALALVGLGAVGVQATSGAHFFSATGSVANNGALQVSWDEAGVGQQQVNYTLSTDAFALYGCINGGGNHPKAANKQSVNGPLTSPNTGFQPQNGRVKVTNGIALGPLPSTLVCPSGQTFVLACVKYTNIALTDTTNNVTANIADTARAFVNITGCPI